jgi:hypothetical protein
MEQRWKKNYRALGDRASSVRANVRMILLALTSSPDRLTTQHLWLHTGFGELKTRSYLSLMEGEGLVDKVKGAAKRHPCRQRACRCYGWGITDAGRTWLGCG